MADKVKYLLYSVGIFVSQVELFTHHDSFNNILKSFEVIDLRLCSVSLIDAHYCADSSKMKVTGVIFY